MIESFLKFDSVLLDSNVKKVLQKLANDEQEEPDQAQESVTSFNPNEELNVEEAQLLKKEAEVPIEELLKRYNGDEKHFHSPNITKRILNNNEEINSDSQTVTNKSDDDTEQKTEVIFTCLSLSCNHCGYLGSTTIIIGTEINITTYAKTNFG